jgi:hypothetical protein
VNWYIVWIFWQWEHRILLIIKGLEILCDLHIQDHWLAASLWVDHHWHQKCRLYFCIHLGSRIWFRVHVSVADDPLCDIIKLYDSFDILMCKFCGINDPSAGHHSPCLENRSTKVTMKLFPLNDVGRSVLQSNSHTLPAALCNM